MVCLCVFVFRHKQTFDNRLDNHTKPKNTHTVTTHTFSLICLAHPRNLCTSWGFHRGFRSWSGSESVPLAAVEGASPHLSSGLWGFPPTPAGGKSATEALGKSKKFRGLAIKHLGVDQKNLAINQHPHQVNMFLSVGFEQRKLGGNHQHFQWKMILLRLLRITHELGRNTISPKTIHVPHYFTCLSVTDVCHSCQTFKTNTALFPLDYLVPGLSSVTAGVSWEGRVLFKLGASIWKCLGIELAAGSTRFALGFTMILPHHWETHGLQAP